MDPGLGAEVARQPWIVDIKQANDGNRARRATRQLLTYIHLIALEDVELARLSVSVPWLLDGATYYELIVLRRLGAIARKDAELAKLIATFQWFTDESFDGLAASDALGGLNDVASSDTMLARLIAELWLADGITQDELLAVPMLRELADIDVELPRHLLGHAWFEDEGNLRGYVLSSLYGLARSHGELLSELTSQNWFTDGVEKREAALVATLSQVASDSPDLYTDLLRTHYNRSRTVSLKLAGEVNIWIVQNTPFPSNDSVLSEIENTARIGEELLGVPFPTTDVILLVVDRSQVRYRVSGAHFDTHMLLIRDDDGSVPSVPHETAHYWFYNPRTGPQWLTEGAAEFIEAYVNDRMERRELYYSRAANTSGFLRCVNDYQVENIRHLAVVLKNKLYIKRPVGCPYDMGEYFLHSLSELVGEKATMSALGELHLSEVGKYYSDVEERIYEVFLKHVPNYKREDFRTFYRQVHGGAAAFDDTVFPDDHGDKAGLATMIDVGEPTKGTLDYMFDFDYFRFHAEEGQKYRIKVSHYNLRAGSVGLYAPDGQTGLNRYWIARELVSTGPRIVWVAPSSDDYYVAVHNFGGKTGRYTLTIDVADDAGDDHGDTQIAATDVSLGEVVRGTINDDLDIDYFRLPVERGQRYFLSVMSVTLEEFQFSVRMPDGGTWTADTEAIRTCCPHGFGFIARGPGNASISITGLGESVGTYTFKVILIDD